MNHRSLIILITRQKKDIVSFVESYCGKSKAIQNETKRETVENKKQLSIN